MRIRKLLLLHNRKKNSKIVSYFTNSKNRIKKKIGIVTFIGQKLLQVTAKVTS